MRDALQSFLEKRVAADGESCADLYFEVLPGFVIMGIDMPGVDGIEGVRMILEDDLEAFIPIANATGC